MKTITFKDLLAEHDYYCSDSNYYRNDAAREYETFREFYDEMRDADIDWNLCFRFDVIANDEKDGFYGNISVMQQRKGKFVPFTIHSIVESDLDMIVEYLTPHWNKMKQIWQPFSN